MSHPQSKAPRLQSLDVFRGLTIAGMILVNKPGDGGEAFAFLKHVPWDGCTPTDWIFPFFLFIVGAAVPLAIENRRNKGVGDAEILKHAIKRSLILFALGMFEKNFPFFTKSFETFRIPGVLQRIAFCYLAATFLLLKTNRRGQIACAVSILAGYWALLAFVPVPGAGGVVAWTRENAAAIWPGFIDQALMGRHLGYDDNTWDANGLLSSVPALVTTLSGVVAVNILRSGEQPAARIKRMLLLGGGAVVFGWLWGGMQGWITLLSIGEPALNGVPFFPINKMTWSSSFVLWTSGLALISLAFCYWLIDVRGARKLGMPFLVLGVNPIFAYLASGILAKTLRSVKWGAEGDTTSLHAWIHDHSFGALPFGGAVDSLLYSLAYLAIWTAICWRLYDKRIFIKL